MATLDSFLPLIRGRLPGCPDIVLKDGVRDAAIEFCRRTELLSAHIDLAVVAGQSHYQLMRAVWGTWECALKAGSRPRTYHSMNDRRSASPGIGIWISAV